MGGRATGRATIQAKDAIVEGLTLAYLGTTLLGDIIVYYPHHGIVINFIGHCRTNNAAFASRSCIWSHW